MMRDTTTARLAIASMLAFALTALTVVPTSAATPWRAKEAEDVAIRLTNCIRSGGLVTSDGKCKGWGKGNHSKAMPTLKRSTRISDRVSWPWVKKSVQWNGTRSCWIGHARQGSTVDRRFAAVSLKHIANGENMGCGMYGTGKQTVVRIIRMWQAEKAWNGPHWRQIKNPDFRSVGVGVARYGNRKTQVVMNFYGKRLD